MYKLCVYVPESHLEEVKQAIFNNGGGRIGNYDSCCWQTSGEGQFRALDNSSPFIGKICEVEKVKEFKIELVCSDKDIYKVITAMKNSHPYETPAYHAWKLEDFDEPR